MTPAPRYVVEIHDVCPPYASRLPMLLDVLPAEARERAALLIVPNWGGDHPLDTAADLVARIAAHPGEKVLHGCTHTLGPDWWNWITYGTEQHAEFARLDTDAATRRLAAGVAIFERALGLPPHWFCAPRWKQSSGTARALAACGLRAYMLADRLAALNGPSVPFAVLQFDEGRRRWRRAAARSLRAGRARRLIAGGKAFRLALHPTDLDDDATRREITAVTHRLQQEGWTPLSLGEALPA